MWVLIRKDLMRRWRSPLATIVMIVFPLFMSLAIGSLGGGGGGSDFPRIKVLLQNKDEDGFLSNAIMGTAGQGEGQEYLELVQVGDEGVDPCAVDSVGERGARAVDAETLGQPVHPLGVEAAGGDEAERPGDGRGAADRDARCVQRLQSLHQPEPALLVVADHVPGHGGARVVHQPDAVGLRHQIAVARQEPLQEVTDTGIVIDHQDMGGALATGVRLAGTR